MPISFKKPMVLLNFKAYKESIGENAVKLAEQAAAAGWQNTYVAVQPTDIFEVKKVWKNVFAQHADPVEPGARTGWIPVESVIAAGAVGTLINHSEHRVPLEHISKVIERARGLGDLNVVSCADTTKNAVEISKFRPTAIAIEPPELIGTKTSISEARPELITETVGALKPTGVAVLCGAGINKPEDVAKAIELGAKGVLVASAFVKAESPKKWLEDVVSVL